MVLQVSRQESVCAPILRSLKANCVDQVFSAVIWLPWFVAPQTLRALSDIPDRLLCLLRPDYPLCDI